MSGILAGCPSEKLLKIPGNPAFMKKIYSGEYVSLKPVEPEKDVDELFHFNGSDANERL